VLQEWVQVEYLLRYLFDAMISLDQLEIQLMPLDVVLF
jgi:hypothetical protein